VCHAKLARWGGWGSNPRPADYEKYGPVQTMAITGCQLQNVTATRPISACPRSVA